MKKEDKNKIIDSLAETFGRYPTFYIADVSNLTVEKTNQFRRKCFGSAVKMRVAKNTLIRKAMEKVNADAYAGLFVSLKGSSAILFSEAPNVPAKLIRDFRRTNDKPLLKSAYVDASVYVGEQYLETLAALKSRHELIGDVVGMLQSPARNVIAALQAGGGKLAGLLKTLETRGASS
jgi:large subunit ribosomal protein L10